MAEIIVHLPEDRVGVGSIRLVNSAGLVVAGPFPALGCTDRATAKLKGNPEGNRLKPYGDTPYGQLAIIDIVKTGGGTEFDPEIYGSVGAIRLKPLSGEALLAERAGRAGFLIQGGGPEQAEAYKATSGSIRISDKDMSLLLESIALLTTTEPPPTICTVEKEATSNSIAKVFDQVKFQSDPPPGMEAGWHVRIASRHQAEQSELIAATSWPQREGHDRESHDRESHDRESHDREAHDREVSRDPAGHDREAASHDREIHDREGHQRVVPPAPPPK